MKQKTIKVISALLAIIILYANSAVLISYAANNFLTEQQIENQGTSTGNSNVEFDVYYAGGAHTKTIDINTDDTKLNIDINVKNAGYLKNITVDFSDANFSIAQAQESSNVKAFDAEAKTVTFNQINNGTRVSEAINIFADKQDQVSKDMFAKDNEINLTATYVNSRGEEEQIQKTIIIHTGWNVEEATSTLNYEITKYIQYTANGINKLITQGKITSGVENSVLPIKETNIQVTAPQINSQYPENVKVIANNTIATNGDESGIDFTQNNWNYDSTTGKVTITTNNNPDTNGNISWRKNTLDEYIVTYIYSEEVLNAVNNSVVRLTYDVSSQISLYNNGTGVTTLTASKNGYQDQQQQLGDIIDFEIETPQSLNKGYMYTNATIETGSEFSTSYNINYNINIPYANVIDKITINQEIDKFITSDNVEYSTTVSGMNYTYNYCVGVSKQEFDKILGESGTITIQNSTGTTITSINNSIQADEGMLWVNISEDTNNITINTTKPQTEGNITITVIKNIKPEIGYTTNQIKQFANLETEAVFTATSGTTEIANKALEKSITLEEPTQKTSITTTPENLSTIIKNEDVKIKVTLESDTIDDILYEDPTIKINLPAGIEEITIKERPQVYFDEELLIKNEPQFTNNADGTKTITIELSGKQTKYNNVAAKGATIILTADITLNNLTPTTDTQITATITNGENQTISTSNIKYVAPTGLVTTNAMTGYNGDKSIMAINGEKQTDLIEIAAPEKEVTFTMNVINNYSNTLDSIVVLGRIPFSGNKDILTSQDLGSNINIPLTSAITVNGANATIYYSENGEATTDLYNTSNNWTTTTSDYSKIKSYMIVLDQTMNTGDSFSFTYKANLPANLEYNKSAYQTYAVYFNNNQSSGTIADKTEATPIGVTTGSKAEFKTTLSANVENGTTIKSGSEVKYTLTVKNIGSKAAENTIAQIIMPENTNYIPENAEEQYTYNIDDDLNSILSINLGTIEANSTFTKTITLKYWASGKQNTTSEVSVTVTSDDEITSTTNTITLNVEKTYFITQAFTQNSNINYIMEGDTYSYVIFIRSSDSSTDEENNDRKNTIVTVTLPDELEYDSIKLTQYSSEELSDIDITSTAEARKNGKTVTINIGDVDGMQGKKLTIYSKVKALPEGIYSKAITTKATIKADNTETEVIEDITDTISRAGIKVTQTCNIPAGTTISATEEFTYTFTIKNLSEIVLDKVTFTDILPEQVQYELLEVIYSDKTTNQTVNQNSDGNPETTVSLKANEEITINVIVSAKSIEQETKITNKATIENELIGKVESSPVSHTIKEFKNTDIDISEEDQTKKIIGTVWIDENKDGVKDVDEQKVSGVTVLLLDNTTSNIAITSEGQQAITTTGEEGSYMFNNIRQGKYTVIFLYDSKNYSATAYQKEGVDPSLNSDAIDNTIVYEGKTQIGAVTEEIVLGSENQYDIDLGIYENAKFDLKLEKIVSNITVNNSKETTTHEYNKNFAKIDFESKYVDGSTMIVEYKFIITNEGAIPGYVKKLADYLPEELKFSTELNKDWYEGKDGTIFNSSLANTIINPGESKEVTLILTKAMTKESFGVITNTAEIYETSNDYGLEDVDSTPGNKNTNEDDISIANIVTGVKTGDVVIYTTLIITVITIIGVGIYLIRKKVLR